MDRSAYIAKLRSALSRLPRAEVAQALQYYNEIFDDAAENGKSETDVIAGLGAPEDAAAQIIADCSQKEDCRRQAFVAAKRQPTMKNYGKSLRASFAAPLNMAA